MMPTQRIAYEYACVMHLAQQFEENMRVIIFLGDQWGDLPDLKLTKKERKRFKEDTSKFLDEAGTCGRLLMALDEAGLVKDRSALKKTVEYRNELAHWFLVEADFDNMNEIAENALVSRNVYNFG